MTGIEMIAKEREEQIFKHNRTIQEDANFNKEDQLIDAMFLIMGSLNPENYLAVKIPPKGWNEVIWHHMLQKNEKEKLILIGAFAAAEIDRRNYLETLKPKIDV